MPRLLIRSTLRLSSCPSSACMSKNFSRWWQFATDPTLQKVSIAIHSIHHRAAVGAGVVIDGVLTGENIAFDRGGAAKGLPVGQRSLGNQSL